MFDEGSEFSVRVKTLTVSDMMTVCLLKTVVNVHKHTLMADFSYFVDHILFLHRLVLK